MTTLYDVAREAKVSIKTVSRVLNNTDKVKEETVKAIEKFLKTYIIRIAHNQK